MAGIATSGITYYELYGSGRGEITQDGSITREYQVAWTDMPAFIRALMGGYFKLNNTNFYFTLPDQDKEWIYFYCQETSHEGIGPHSIGPSGAIAYSHAKITAKYSGLKFDPNATIKDIFTQDLDWSAEQLTIPGGSVKSPGGTVINDPIRIVIPTTDYTLTLDSVPELPGGDTTLIMNITANPLNNGPFLGGAKHTVMYKGARATRTTTNQGAKNWHLVHKFCHRPIPWTQVWSKADGAFVEAITVNGGGVPLYGDSDLTQLLPR